MSPADPSATFHDELVRPGAVDLPDRFFDRLMFNAHPVDALEPALILGCGIYPGTNTIDGFATVCAGGEQRNLRWSTELDSTDGLGGGPFRFEVVEPMKVWRIRLEPNEIGLELDLEWTARAPASWSTVEVHNAGAAPTSFDHLFQSGRYRGTVRIDGHGHEADGWYGQRDRSRGVRTMTGGQGLHLWFQAQFPTYSVGILLVESRSGGLIVLEGDVMHESGTLDPVTSATHSLRFDADLDLRAGVLEVQTRSGRTLRIDINASGRGTLMAGAGYGGHHGRPMGRDHLEHDVYPLDGSVTPRTLDASLTDRLARFSCDGTEGIGIVEFALTRSPAYHYLPTLPA